MSGRFDVTSLSTTSLRRGTKTTSLNTNFTDSFIQNDLISARYETTPIQGSMSRMPGYAGFIPGGLSCYGQRKAQATLHTETLRPMLHATKGACQDMQLVDLRPEERAYNKNYVYAENVKSGHASFMTFPNSRKATFDHRRL